MEWDQTSTRLEQMSSPGPLQRDEREIPRLDARGGSRCREQLGAYAAAAASSRPVLLTGSVPPVRRGLFAP